MDTVNIVLKTFSEQTSNNLDAYWFNQAISFQIRPFGLIKTGENSSKTRQQIWKNQNWYFVLTQLFFFDNFFGANIQNFGCVLNWFSKAIKLQIGPFGLIETREKYSKTRQQFWKNNFFDSTCSRSYSTTPHWTLFLTRQTSLPAHNTSAGPLSQKFTRQFWRNRTQTFRPSFGHDCFFSELTSTSRRACGLAHVARDWTSMQFMAEWEMSARL